MTANSIVILLNFAAAASALLAALLWHRSGVVQVPHKDEPDASGLYPAAIVVGDNVDFISTAIAQSSWSKRAAYAAAAAAAFQGLALLIGGFAA